MQADKANIERMQEAVEGANYENMQYLISEAKWDFQAVVERLADVANELIGDAQDACLLFDESYFEKKGVESAGVARQWNGRLGKTENSQVGVFAALANGNLVCPIGSRLYLPKEWTDDQERMRKAKVPEEYRTFRTKHELALELVDRMTRNGLQFGWVAADGFYGHCAQFMWGPRRRGLTFALNVHSNDHVFMSDPQPYLPKKKGDRGRNPKWRTKEESFRADTWTDDTPPGTWRRIKARNSTVGELWLEALSCPVWQFNKETGEVCRLTLVITRDANTMKDVKYTLSNASPDTPLERLVYMVAQRFWVERGFQEAKENVGMAQYQVRGWLGWHRHMTLVMMALSFMLKLKVKHTADVKLLSCADVKQVLARCLPNRRITPGEVARQLRLRHEKRRKSAERHYRAQGQPVPEPWRDAEP